ncbi:hypothetical protein [Lysobacter gummosus]
MQGPAATRRRRPRPPSFVDAIRSARRGGLQAAIERSKARSLSP